MRLATLLLTTLLFVPLAYAGDGVQIVPDGSAILVNKDVNGERWAISLDLREQTPLNVTGNVTRPGGGEPAFLWCELTDVTGSAEDIRNARFRWQCFGSNRCPAPPCLEHWTFVADVSLPGRFFLP